VRATVRLRSACDNACAFCAQDGLDPLERPLEDARQALADARQDAHEVTLLGGEPTGYEALPEVLRLARALGFERVGLQTHARRLRDRTYTEGLVGAGLTDVHVSLHGATEALHDYHTGTDGSFTQSLGGIAQARAQGVPVVVLTVVTRSNHRNLAELPRLLRARGVAAWTLALPHAAGRAAEAFDRVLPRLALSLPAVLHAVESARTLGLPAWLQGAPLCLTGPYAHRALPDAPRAYGEPCQRCEARPVCPGVDAAYLARFQGDELTPRACPTLAADHPALARMFVGPGPLARRSLPMLR
jgi:MoaA/NifB/PqqE/SkfB family radical SAM enzyme